MTFKSATFEFNGKRIRLYEAAYKGRVQSFATLREALLYKMGYGTDQAAELRWLADKKNKGGLNAC